MEKDCSRLHRDDAMRQRHRARCCLKEETSDFTDALRQLYFQRSYPPFGDVMESDIFGTVLWDTAMDVSLTDEHFAEGFRKVPPFTEEYRGMDDQKTQELLEVVQHSEPTATIRDLGLVSTIFSCGRCNNLVWYPQIFNHRCFH
jgi:hypothetical protein